MRIASGKIAHLVFILLLITNILLPGCNTGKTANDTRTSPIDVQLSFPNGVPKLNQTAELKCLVKVIDSGPGGTLIRATISLPEGIELISGNLTFNLNSALSGTRDFTVIIKPVNTGNYTIKCKFLYPNNQICGIYEVYLMVTQSASEWGNFPPWWTKGETETKVTPLIKPMVLCDLNLSFPQPPVLNKTADIAFQVTVRPNSQYSNTKQNKSTTVETQVRLPDGFKIISGIPQDFKSIRGQINIDIYGTIISWLSDCSIQTETKKDFKIVIEAVQEGDWQISIWALIPHEINDGKIDGQIISASQTVRIKLDKSTAVFLPLPTPAPPPPPPATMPDGSIKYFK